MALLAAAVVVVACRSPLDPFAPPVSGAPLTVFAAASLRLAVEQAAYRYEATRPGIVLRVSTGSSTALRVQIEQGARADVFLSADTANPDALVAAGLAATPPVVFARTQPVIVVRTDDPAGISSPADLARPGLRIVAAGDGVPITVYAARLLERLASEPGYPVGYVDAVLANVVSREDDVRAVLTKIELGEGDAAIVYATDARASSRVRVVPLPAGVEIPVSYAAVVLADAPRPDLAPAFLAWLTGPEGIELLGDFGFEAGSP